MSVVGPRAGVTCFAERAVTGPRSLPTGLSRLVAVVPELASAVLDRIDDDLLALRQAPCRDRLADEAFLRTAIALSLQASAVLTGPDLAALADHIRALAQRAAPLGTVQRFHGAGVAHLFTELWSRAEPGDLNELLHLSRSSVAHHIEVERLLLQVYSPSSDSGRCVRTHGRPRPNCCCTVWSSRAAGLTRRSTWWWFARDHHPPKAPARRRAVGGRRGTPAPARARHPRPGERGDVAGGPPVDGGAAGTADRWHGRRRAGWHRRAAAATSPSLSAWRQAW